MICKVDMYDVLALTKLSPYRVLDFKYVLTT